MTKREISIVDSIMAMPKKDWKNASTVRGCYHGSVYMAEKNGYSVCISFKTPIAMLTPKKQIVRLWGGYSKTSIEHFNDWASQLNLPFITGKVWDKMKVGAKYPLDYPIFVS